MYLKLILRSGFIQLLHGELLNEVSQAASTWTLRLRLSLRASAILQLVLLKWKSELNSGFVLWYVCSIVCWLPLMFIGITRLVAICMFSIKFFTETASKLGFYANSETIPSPVMPFPCLDCEFFLGMLTTLAWNVSKAKPAQAATTVSPVSPAFAAAHADTMTLVRFWQEDVGGHASFRKLKLSSQFEPDQRNRTDSIVLNQQYSQRARGFG